MPKQAGLAELIRPLAFDPSDYDALLADIGDARFVLIGEASHGTHEFYRERAAITRRLIVEKGFVAVPVGAAETCAEFQGEADEVVCGQTPEPFHAVGLWYEDFSQTSDAEVHDLLQQATTANPSAT